MRNTSFKPNGTHLWYQRRWDTGSIPAATQVAVEIWMLDVCGPTNLFANIFC
jgi:hypothetical protein